MSRRRIVSLAARLGLLALVALGFTVSRLLAEETVYQAPALDLTHADNADDSPAIGQLGPHRWRAGDLDVVVAWGSPREMGRQFGEAMADEIKVGVEQYLHARVRDRLGYEMDYQRRCAAAMEPHIRPEYIEEMKGVAEGAGVTYEEILLMPTHADMVHYGKGWSLEAGGEKREAGDGGAQECSNFAVFGQHTVGGKLIHGRNLDWTTSTGIQEHGCVYIGLPEEGNAFALVTYPGVIGAVTGMNARGITFGEMTSSSSDETLDGMPLMFICRQILQHCDTIGDVDEMVASYPCTTGWNFVVGDGQGPDARAYEVDAGDVGVFGPGDAAEDHRPISWPLPEAVRRTNHYLSPEMQEKQAKRYGVTNLALAKAVLPTMDTWQRYAALSQWIESKPQGKIDARIARAMLQSAPVAGNGNLHSVVFDATDRVMWVANASLTEPAWKQTYVRIELAEWLSRAP